MSLNNFYNTQMWRDFRDIVIAQRLNERGEIICEHCGKPIVKRYDLILHHSIPLDESNYMNADIAFNPDLIQLVHHRCHNTIHNKLGYAQRQVFLVYGSPLARKTTYVKENMQEGDLIIDIDNIWQAISGCDRYVKPNRLKSNVFAVRDLLIDNVRVRRGKWSAAWLLGGYPLISERERLLNALGAREIFIDTPKEECLKNLYACGDRNIEAWEKYIEDWWRQYSPPASL